MKRFQISKVLAMILAFLFISGCAARQITRPPNPSNPIRTIAVLPMLNNSGDVEGPERVRKEFYQRIGNFHYSVQPLEETNRILNEQMGITLGKQLDMVTPQKLGETLGVEGVFYGYLLNFDEITTGVINIYKVRMGWKLVNAKTGEIAWGQGISIKRVQSIGGIAGMGSLEADKVGPLPGSADPMAEMPGLNKWIMMKSESVDPIEGLVLGLGGKLLDGITDGRLKKETEYAFQRLFPGMLAGPGGGAIAVKQ